MENEDLPLLSDLEQQLRLKNQDMSNTIARIHVSAMQLEAHDPGFWWDIERSTLRLRHVAVASWMQRYGFQSMNDLPPEALVAFDVSLRRRLEKFEKALAPCPNQPTDGSQQQLSLLN